MKKIRRIRQRNKSDCGIACVAMMAGVRYREAFRAFDFAEDEVKLYTTHGRLISALEKLGCKVKKRKFSSWGGITNCAIIPVNHRCNRKKFHWVVYDGKSVLDPNPRCPPRTKKFDGYRASGVYLLSASTHRK